jgi:hypothetical protein
MSRHRIEQRRRRDGRVGCAGDGAYYGNAVYAGGENIRKSFEVDAANGNDGNVKGVYYGSKGVEADWVGQAGF